MDSGVEGQNRAAAVGGVVEDAQPAEGGVGPLQDGVQRERRAQGVGDELAQHAPVADHQDPLAGVLREQRGPGGAHAPGEGGVGLAARRRHGDGIREEDRQILAGLRLGVIRGCKGVVVGQLLVSIIGIGALFKFYSQNFLMEHFWALVLLIFVAALGTASAVEAIERRVSYYAGDRN